MTIRRYARTYSHGVIDILRFRVHGFSKLMRRPRLSGDGLRIVILAPFLYHHQPFRRASLAQGLVIRQRRSSASESLAASASQPENLNACASQWRRFGRGWT
jgi:hypothetical protein